MLVDRLSPGELFSYLYACIFDVFENGKVGKARRHCVRPPTAAEVVSGKAAWKRFLEEHGSAIREGKRFDMVDYDTAPSMTLPMERRDLDPESPSDCGK